MATITINGRSVEAEAGAPLVEVIKNAGFPISNLWLSGWAAAVRRLPNLCGRSRGHARPAAFLHDHGDGWHGRAH